MILELAETDPSLREGLEKIRRRRRLRWIVILSFFPAVPILSVLATWISGSSKSTLLIGLVWLVLYIVAQLYVTQSVCPRCGNRFHSRGWYSNAFTRHCLNCDLPLYPTTDGSNT